MPRAKLRTPELRDRVLQVAVAMLAAEGAGALTARRVAEQARTSTPAVYELFGDKAGLVREVFFEGFRLLGQRFGTLAESGDPRRDLVEVTRAFRGFVRDYPVLGQLMFARPFAEFDPGPAEREAGRATREFVVARVRRCVEAGLIAGDPTDVAHVLLALCQGLAAQEAGGWLGTSAASRNRRWDLAAGSLLAGLSPHAGSW